MCWRSYGGGRLSPPVFYPDSRTHMGTGMEAAGLGKFLPDSPDSGNLAARIHQMPTAIAIKHHIKNQIIIIIFSRKSIDPARKIFAKKLAYLEII